jgi:hypothetical protein
LDASVHIENYPRLDLAVEESIGSVEISMFSNFCTFEWRHGDDKMRIFLSPEQMGPFIKMMSSIPITLTDDLKDSK